MSFYVVADHSGNYLTKDAGRPYKVSDIRRAKQFPSEDHASAFLKNQVPLSVRQNYFAAKCDEDVQISQPANEDHRNLQKMNAALFEKVIDCMDFEDTSAESDLQSFTIARAEELKQKLSIADRRICDIQHYIEFGNFNAYQGWLCFKMLQKALRQRRKIKNEHRILDSIMTSYHHLQNEIQKEQSNQGCHYEPRELKHLFVRTL